jgi:hypothetical protein
VFPWIIYGCCPLFSFSTVLVVTFHNSFISLRSIFMVDVLYVWTLLTVAATLFGTLCSYKLQQYIRHLFGAAPSVPVTRVSRYLTATQGLTTFLEPSRRRALWKRAAKQIRRILKLRILWNRLGIWLQNGAVQDLVTGLERRKGNLNRTSIAPCPPIQEIMSSIAAPLMQVRAARGRSSRP